MNNKLAIIIPIPELFENTPFELTNALDSLVKQKNKNFEVFLATFKQYRSEVEELIKKFQLDINLDWIELSDELKFLYPNYCEIVNFAVQSDKIKSNYFTILQFDDVVNNTYIKNFDQYATAYPSVSVFLPIVLEFDGKDFTRSVNEIVWNFGFTGKEGRQGYLDFATLKQFNIFSYVSAIYKIEDFLAEGGYKPSIKKYFEYEYMLRVSNKIQEIMVIPKFMVRHRVNRQNSLSSYYNQMDKLEDKFYLDLARKEYFFDEDRNISYTPPQN